MVVDVVIFHWVALVSGEEAVPDGLGRVVQWMTALFYANDGLLASPRTDLLRAVPDVLTGLFDRVDLQTNVYKTVGMVFQTYYIVGGPS